MYTVQYKQIKQRTRTHVMYCKYCTSTQLAQINYEIKINPELGGYRSGLGICSSVFRAICSFFERERVKEQLTCEKERIDSVTLLSCTSCANHSWSLFSHEQPEQIAHSRSFVKSDGSESLKSLI